MINNLKNKVKLFFKNLIGIDKYAKLQDDRWAPQTKILQAKLLQYYQYCAANNLKIDLSSAGFRVFSQFDEDGILLAIFGLIGTTNKIFVDIGSSDCINSNCANLAINFGWYGLFIDGSKEKINIGLDFYNSHPDTWAYPPKFKNAFVTRENINELIEKEGFKGEIDLLSIDIDGNDYWVWDALEIISPRVVIIETHVEFGFNSIVVPYNKDYVYPGKHPQYHGASVVAMNKLANKKGYRLIASNCYGFNTIYVKNGIAENLLPEVSVEYILRHNRNKERFKLFEEIKDWDYIIV